MSWLAVVALLAGAIAASCVALAFLIGSWRAIDRRADTSHYPSDDDHRHRRAP